MSSCNVLELVDDLLSYVDVPTKSNEISTTIDSSKYKVETNCGDVQGLCLIHDFISKEEEKLIMHELDNPDQPEPWKQLTASSKYREQIFYGNKLNFSNSEAFEPHPKAPSNIEQIGNKLKLFIEDYNKKNSENPIVGDFSNYHDSTKMEIVVNKYGNKDALGFHFDQAEYFGDCISGLSIQCDSVISFRRNFNARRKTRSIALPNRSMYIMTEDARYKWKHGILHNKITNGDYRVSLTWREISLENC